MRILNLDIILKILAQERRLIILEVLTMNMTSILTRLIPLMG